MHGAKNLSQETYFLLQSSFKSIPFNIILALVISVNLYLNQVAFSLIFSWFFSVCSISVLRWGYSRSALNKEYYLANTWRCLLYFCLLTFVTGAIWGASYFLFSPYINTAQEFIIILVLGGMCAGGMASLSVYMPAYYCFLLPIFLPLIIFNLFIFQLDEVIVAIMCALFTIMLIITAQVNSQLLKKNFILGEEKDKLIDDLKESNQKLEQSIEEIRQMSITDSLTGLFNRRHFNAMIKNEFNRAKRNKYNLTLILIDIDNFKYINDTFGHPYGDNFLVQVAGSIKNSIKRANDSVYRLGGDEFAVLLANLSLEDSLTLCGRIQETFRVQIAKEEVSLSMGVINISVNSATDIENVISIADTNLYEAKKQGKNKVISNRISDDEL